MFKVKELSDLFADACICNESGELVLLSCYGRDTAVQQLLAAFYLKPAEGGLGAITLVDEMGKCDGAEYRIVVKSDRLTKVTGRFPRQNLFGNLVHTWIFDPVIQKPDPALRSAWLLDASEGTPVSALRPRIWELIKELSPVPLLEHWGEVILSSVPGLVRNLEESAYPPIGPVRALRVNLPEDFPDLVSSLVMNGQLQLAGSFAPV